MNLLRKLSLGITVCALAMTSPTAVGEKFRRVKGVKYTVPGSRTVACKSRAGCGTLFCAKECARSPDDCLSYSYSRTEGLCLIHPRYFSAGSPDAVADLSWSTYESDRPRACASGPCQNGGTCNDVITGGFTCTCAGSYTGEVCQTLPMWRDCKAALDAGQSVSGVYTVYPDEITPVEVYCNQDIDSGGWVVFQRREDGSQDFDLSMEDYENGFGDLSGEFWLGLTKMNKFLANGAHTLRVDMGSSPSLTKSASYSDFSMDAGTNTLRYAAFLGGEAGDCLGGYSRNMDFTKPVYPPGFCADITYGAWWFNQCYGCNLNGLYGATNGGGVKWTTNGGSMTSLPWTEMKIRPSA